MKYATEAIGDVLVIHLHVGEGEAERVRQLGQLKAEVSRALDEERLRIVLDVGELDFMDSSGMGALVACTRLVEERGGTFIVYGIGLRLAETLHIVRLNQVIPFRLSLEEALAVAAVERVEPGFASLIAGNPTLAEVRSWWSREAGSMAPKERSQLPPERPRKAPEPKRSAEFLSDWDSPDIVRLQNLIQGNHNLHDWMQALSLFSEAKRLSLRYGIDFNAEMSFKEFLSMLADSLSTPK